MEWTAQLGRIPALLPLVSYALGIYLQSKSHSLGLLCLGCGSIALIISLALPSKAQYWRGKTISLYTALAFCFVALGIFRTSWIVEEPYIGQEHSLRSQLASSLRNTDLTDETQRLMNAISLGYLPKDEVSQTLRQDFARSAAAHLLAVSGYHLALVVYCLSLILGRLRLSSARLYFVVLMLSAWAFTALTHWSVPTVRAALMLSLYLGGRMLGKRPDVPNILAVSALIQLLWKPSDLFSWSMYLSYVAVLSIYLYYKPLLHWLGGLRNPLLRTLWEWIALTLSAQVLTLPLVLYLFGYISFAFVVTALPMIFLANLTIPLSLLAYTLQGIGLGLGLMADALNILTASMLSITSWASELDILIVSYSFPFWALLLWWLLCFTWAYYLPTQHKRSTLPSHL